MDRRSGLHIALRHINYRPLTMVGRVELAGAVGYCMAAGSLGRDAAQNLDMRYGKFFGRGTFAGSDAVEQSDVRCRRLVR